MIDRPLPPGEVTGGENTLSRQEFTWARAAGRASQGLIMKILLQWISNCVDQNHTPGSTWQWVKCHRTGESDVMRFFVQNVPPQEGGPYWVQGMRSRGGTNRASGAEWARHATGQPKESDFETVVRILLSPPVKIGPKPALCFT